MNRRALERGDLCASFEPYSNLVRGVVASLSSKMYSLFFEKVVFTKELDHPIPVIQMEKQNHEIQFLLNILSNIFPLT